MMKKILLMLFFALLGGNAAWAEIADRVVVYKERRIMQLLADGEVLRTYAIGLGDDPIGHKRQEGDERTPEGDYVIDYRNPQSGYHFSLHISYPNAQDKAAANKAGVNPGGMIMIHGLPNGYGWAKHYFAGRDWTDGCIAVDNDEIDEIARMVKDGTPITINP